MEVEWSLDILAHDKLLTNVANVRRGLRPSGMCCLCRLSKETTIHALRDCLFAHGVWLQLGVLYHDPYFFAYDFVDWLALNLASKLCIMERGNKVPLEWNAVFLVKGYAFWWFDCFFG